MPESLTANTSADNHKINFRESEELKRWASKLNCSVVDLIAAIYAVGDTASMVREYLKKSHFHRQSK